MPRKTTKTKTANTQSENGAMNKEARNEIVPAQLPATALSNIDSFLEATATESAKFLKFAKGEWLAGVD